MLKKIDPNIEYGDYSYGMENIKVLHANEGYKVVIGKFCSIAKNIKVFIGANHRTDFASTYPFGHLKRNQSKKIIKTPAILGHPSSNGDVIIGNDVYIGFNATIMSGIKIGHGSVIAANSHVSKNIPPYEIWGGNPAKRIKKRFSNEIIKELLLIKWWDYQEEKIREIIPFLSSKISNLQIKKIKSILKN